MNYNELAKEVHQNAVAHGWWETDRSYEEVIALIHSELSEALEEYRDGKQMLYYKDSNCNKGGDCAPEDNMDCPCDETQCMYFVPGKPEGIIVELADVVIRILDYCGRRSIDIGDELDLRSAGNDTNTLPELVVRCHYLISMAYTNVELCSRYFAKCISLIDFWCLENGTTLETAISIKHEYNKTRPYRHGGKVI